MHSYTGKNGTTFHFNGDYSGNIICHNGNLQFKIDGKDFVEFAKQAVFDEIRGNIENLLENLGP